MDSFDVTLWGSFWCYMDFESNKKDLILILDQMFEKYWHWNILNQIN